MLCNICRESAPTLNCTSCESNRALCQTCWDFVHRFKSRAEHKPKPICSQCWNACSRMTCNICQLGFCLDCVQQHAAACDEQQKNKQMSIQAVKQEIQSAPFKGSKARSLGSKTSQAQVLDLCSDDDSVPAVPESGPAEPSDQFRSPEPSRALQDCAPHTPFQTPVAPLVSQGLQTPAARVPSTQVDTPTSPCVQIAGFEELCPPTHATDPNIQHCNASEKSAAPSKAAPEAPEAPAPPAHVTSQISHGSDMYRGCRIAIPLQTRAAYHYNAFMAPDPPLPVPTYSMSWPTPTPITQAAHAAPPPETAAAEQDALPECATDTHVAAEDFRETRTFTHEDHAQQAACLDDHASPSAYHDVHLDDAGVETDDISEGGSVSGDDQVSEEDVGSECEAEADELLEKIGFEVNDPEPDTPSQSYTSADSEREDGEEEMSEWDNDDSADENYVPDEELSAGDKRKRSQQVPGAKPVTAEERQAAKRAKQSEKDAAKAAKQAEREAQLALRAKARLEKDIENAKIATEWGPLFLFKRKSHPTVPDQMLQKLEKLLKAASEDGGNQAEKDQAMSIAQKLMTRYKLEQADVLGFCQSEAEEAAEAFDVLLRGLYRWWPEWGKTLTHVAEAMTGARQCWSSPKPVAYTADGKKDMEGGTRVTFYGVAADARLAAYIFETAYNTVQAKGVERFPPGTKSTRTRTEDGSWNEATITRIKKNDYRQGLAAGLLETAVVNKRQRMKDLEDEAVKKKEEERKAVEAEQTRLTEDAERVKKARADAAAAAAAKKEQARAAAETLEREHRQAKEAEKQQKRAEAAAKRAADKKKAAEQADEDKREENKKLRKEHPEWVWTPCVWAETTAQIKADRAAELSEVKADAARRIALKKQEDQRKAQEKEAHLKAAAEDLAKQEAERAQREAEAAAAAKEAAEKLQEIEEHQKETQQLTIYVPFAKKVVECAEKVVFVLTNQHFAQKIGAKIRDKHVPRTVKNQEEYDKGLEDSKQVHLGAKALTETAETAMFQGLDFPAEPVSASTEEQRALLQQACQQFPGFRADGPPLSLHFDPPPVHQAQQMKRKLSDVSGQL